MRQRLTLHSPLARWGFTALTLLAIATRQPLPAVIVGLLAVTAWTT